jgi:dihydrofolate reductase
MVNRGNMGKLIYSTLTSLDGYIADDVGNFDWAEPQEDVHRYINILEDKTSLVLYGRKMYEILSVWEHIPDLENQPEYIKEYERAWKKQRKIVFSLKLNAVTTSNTELRKSFDRDEIVRMKRDESGDIGIGGANLASQALDLGLIDEIMIFIYPIVIGKGIKWLSTIKPVQLETKDIKEFKNGVVMIHYSVK